MISWSIMPVVWLVLAIALAFVESATVALVAIWFAAGALAAILPALLGLNIWIQLGVFVVVSVITLWFTRPLVKAKINSRTVRTNADSNVGKIGVVLQDIGLPGQPGRVSVSGLDWAARSETEEFIPVGEQVLVKAIEGVTLIVEKLV